MSESQAIMFQAAYHLCNIYYQCDNPDTFDEFKTRTLSYIQDEPVYYQGLTAHFYCDSLIIGFINFVCRLVWYEQRNET